MEPKKRKKKGGYLPTIHTPSRTTKKKKKHRRAYSYSSTHQHPSTNSNPISIAWLFPSLLSNLRHKPLPPPASPTTHGPKKKKWLNATSSSPSSSSSSSSSSLLSATSSMLFRTRSRSSVGRLSVTRRINLGFPEGPPWEGDMFLRYTISFSGSHSWPSLFERGIGMTVLKG